ncbi:MAG: hypothetical protein FJ137_16430 [Deltaproteobacteria bacterium]|nr:hypothetical protein [Deltaproteobacteria bacterium]
MAGGGAGNGWIKKLVVGGAVVGAATLAPRLLGEGVVPAWLHAVALGLGGLAVVFGSCEAMIKSVEGVGRRLGWNPFVAGTMAGLASNVPELVMLGFVLAAAPRVGFIVTCLTLHVGALAFGLYSGFLPRDQTGHARLPEALVKISTDLFAAAAGVFLGTGLVMMMLRAFGAGDHGGEGLGVLDLCVLGVALLAVQVVATVELVKRFSGAPDGAPDGEPAGKAAGQAGDVGGAPEPPPGWGSIAGFGVVGLVASVVGGHAVGDFADSLVEGLAARGYAEMVGALLLSVFASAGAFAMIVTSHRQRLYDVALASAAGQVSQVPFVVLPVAMLLLAALASMGVIPIAASGAVLPIDLETTSVMVLAFPPMLMLWKAVQDDGQVSWVETAAMVCVFGIVIYLLAVHG